MTYASFLSTKTHLAGDHGFAPMSIPNHLYDFQKALLDWSVRKGRAAVFADCGLGKTPLQLAWAENVVAYSGGRVLVLTPLAVAAQTEREAQKFGVEAVASRGGALPAKIVITNYDQLHHYNPQDFTGVVCDESSILKNFDGATRAAITDFARKLPYRLLCTATAAPNDYIELGTSSEAIGELGFADMVTKFFKRTEQTWTRRDQYRGENYRFRGHAERDFWRWVCSWARAIRRPSDIGGDDGPFVLPPLDVHTHIVQAARPREGCLFEVPAVGLAEQREERRRTLVERCEKAAALVADTGRPAVCWCHLNDEGDLLERLVPGAAQVAGKHSDEEKTERLRAFADGDVRVLVTKPTIAGFGLNWQHCAHQTFFPSHSFEQWYQAVRRCWRFGQTQTVVIDVVTSEGEADVMANLRRKQEAADAMFARLVAMMDDALIVRPSRGQPKALEVPSWLQ